jgi:hypothetical protein
MYAWRPELPTSIDGEPLAVSIQDLFFQFPYERVADNGFVGLTFRPEVMMLVSLAYVASKPALTALAKAVGFSGKSQGFRMAVAAHNLGLALFSGIVMINSWSIVLSHVSNEGFDAIYCDRDGSLWGKGGLGSWATIFYVSKYYEFVDTWVLILKVRLTFALRTYSMVLQPSPKTSPNVVHRGRNRLFYRPTITLEWF